MRLGCPIDAHEPVAFILPFRNRRRDVRPVGEELGEFEANLSGNLYKLWNRLSRAAGSAPRMGLHIWRCLPSSRYRCGLGLALCQRASDEPASRGDQQPGDARQSRRRPPRSSRMASDGRKAADPKKHQPTSPATLSPELNPARMSGRFLRQNHLSNRVFESYTDIVDACCAAWNAIVSEPNRITQSPNEIGRPSVSPLMPLVSVRPCRAMSLPVAPRRGASGRDAIA